MRSVINDIHGSLIGNNYIIQTIYMTILSNSINVFDMKAEKKLLFDKYKQLARKNKSENNKWMYWLATIR